MSAGLDQCLDGTQLLFTFRWFPIESSETAHLHCQFWNALELALDSTWITRNSMRKTSLRQRFPVSQWLVGLKALYSRVIENSNDPIITATADNDVHLEQQICSPKTRELLIRSGLPELTYGKDIRLLQEKIEVYDNQQKDDSNSSSKMPIDPEILPEKDDLPKTENNRDSNCSSCTTNASESIINSLIVEDSCDFKLLPLGKISPLMIGSLQFKKSSSYGSFSKRNVSEISISAMFDSVSLDAIRKDASYTVRSFEQFCDDDGVVAAQYKIDLAKINSQNSHTDLCVAETIRAAEIAYFWSLR